MADVLHETNYVIICLRETKKATNKFCHDSDLCTSQV